MLLAGGLAAGIWVAISVIGGDADRPTADKHDEVAGLGTAPHEVIGAAPQAGDRVLAEGSNWTFVVTQRQALELRGPKSVATVSSYTRPVTLNEASAFKVSREGAAVTLVAGPVHEDAVEVVVETVAGVATESRLLTAHDLQWFFAEIPGAARVSAITARGADGVIVDEYTLPPMPPDALNPPVDHPSRGFAPPPASAPCRAPGLSHESP